MRTSGLLEEIKSRVDIVDFISSYVHLKKAGQNWKGVCPFHSEKTPSFMVSPSKQIFHCFGCSAGGDVITFASKYENITFNEALTLLAKKAGIPLDQGKQASRAYEKQERIRDALRHAAEFYARKLQDSDTARDYVKRRGVSVSSLEQFGIGYAPQGWDHLLRHLRRAGFGDDIIREAGLAVAGTKGLYDMFRNRIMFPIKGTGGSVLAFGGRAMDDATPKYINSPETTVFKKSDTLFGLHEAKETIRREDCVVIVEGYMDVIICHQHGFSHAVAPLGTALTAGQIRKLRTMTGNALLVFDGDDAGKAAARRVLPLVSERNFRTRVLMLPPDEDPDSFLRKQGKDAFAELLKGAGSMVGFILNTSRGGKAETVREALGVLAVMEDTLLADELLGELAAGSKIDETTIRREFLKMKKPAAATSAAVQGRDLVMIQRAERLLLSAIVAFPDRADFVLSRIDAADIRDKIVGALLRRFAVAGTISDMTPILEEASEEERALVTKLSVEPGFDTENVERIIDDCVRTIERRKLEERHQRAQQSGDTADLNEYLDEKRRFVKEAG